MSRLTTTITPRPLRVGGMAFGNGVLMRSPHYWAWARDDGSVMHRPVHTVLDRHRYLRLPIVRSAVGLAEMLALIVSLHARNGGRRIARLVFWVALFFAADLGLGFGLAFVFESRLLYDVTLAVFDLGLAFLVLRQGLGREVWRYHGAEHKAVNAYEAGADLKDLQAIATFSRVHDRCGTNLVVIAGVLMVVGYVLAANVPAAGPLAGVFALLALVVALEFFRLITRRPRSFAGKVFLAGGKALQRCVTTQEPGPEHLQLACAALTRVLELEGALRSALPQALLAPADSSRSTLMR